MPRTVQVSSPRAISDVRVGEIRVWASIALVVAAMVWSYWPTMYNLFLDWQRDDNYSVGQLVPLAALYLVWQERHGLSRCRVTPCWWGLVLVLLGEAGRAFGLLWLYESAERYALVLTIIGTVLLAAGRDVFRHVRWILLFLFLMVPLPGRIHNLISGPLQTWATTGAVFCLELFGMTITREGNVMVLNHTVEVAVAEQCSGLRMLTAFIVLAATLAFVVKRARWQKIVLLVSSIPVAIACNIVRLVATAALFATVSSDAAEKFFHDFAGWTMMPMAIFVLMFELWIMAKLVVDESAEDRS